jgi:hypothetical protein
MIEGCRAVSRTHGYGAGDPKRTDSAPDSNPQHRKIHYISSRLRYFFPCSSVKSLSGASMNIHETKKYLIDVSKFKQVTIFSDHFV